MKEFLVGIGFTLAEFKNRFFEDTGLEEAPVFPGMGFEHYETEEYGEVVAGLGTGWVFSLTQCKALHMTNDGGEEGFSFADFLFGTGMSMQQFQQFLADEGLSQKFTLPSSVSNVEPASDDSNGQCPTVSFCNHINNGM
jgi:hypothetical protein